MAEGTEVQDLLRHDTPFYAENVAKIVSAKGDVIPLVPRKAQLELDAKLEAQHAAGQPMRAIVCKARKLGFSSWVQIKMLQRVTQNANHRALTVAHDGKTAAELFDIGSTAYDHLPTDPELAYLRPPTSGERRSGTTRQLVFGQPARKLRQAGDLGLNSKLYVDTAREIQGGRGFTYHSMHLSEVAFWESEQKMTSLLNAVPREHGTMVIIESTANGFNHFQKRWQRAEDGISAYVTVFAPWHEEPSYQIPFPSEEEKARFVDTIGTGPYGEDEPNLVETYRCTPEQLNWRRMMIADECNDDINTFHQEFPSNPEEAFVASGSTVFAKHLIQRVKDRTKVTDEQAVPGYFEGADHRTVSTRSGTIQVPQKVLWTPDPKGDWRMWAPPVTEESETGKPKDEQEPLGQYIVPADVAGGEAGTDLAWNAIHVIDHRTREQVAEYRSKCDEAELALQMILAGLFYNRAWLAPEITGGWGLSVARIIALDYRYPAVHRRKQLEGTKQKLQDRLGWDTNTKTKPMIEANMRELLRTDSHGIRSGMLATEMSTYVTDARGRSGPQEGAFSDLLMAYMIGQYLAHEIALRDRKSLGGGQVIDMRTRKTVNQGMGY